MNKHIKNPYVQGGVGVLVLVLLLILLGGGDKEQVANEEEREFVTVPSTSGGQSTVKLPVPQSFSPKGEFPFNFTEKNLVKDTPFGDFKYESFDFNNYYRFSGFTTITGQVVFMKSDGSHNLGIKVEKKDAYKLPQYYLESATSPDGQNKYLRSNDPYGVCFGYYYPLQYDYNQLLEKLKSKAWETVTVKISNYKILVNKDYIGSCANLIEIVD